MRFSMSDRGRSGRVFCCSVTCYGVYSDPAERERNPYDLPCCLAVACDVLLSFGARVTELVQSGQPVAGLTSDFLSPLVYLGASVLQARRGGSPWWVLLLLLVFLWF